MYLDCHKVTLNVRHGMQTAADTERARDLAFEVSALQRSLGERDTRIASLLSSSHDSSPTRPDLQLEKLEAQLQLRDDRIRELEGYLVCPRSRGSSPARKALVVEAADAEARGLLGEIRDLNMRLEGVRCTSKEGASAAALDALQLQCIVAAKDREIYLLRSQLAPTSQMPPSKGAHVSNRQDGAHLDAEQAAAREVAEARGALEGEVANLQATLERMHHERTELCRKVAALEGSVIMLKERNCLAEAADSGRATQHLGLSLAGKVGTAAEAVAGGTCVADVTVQEVRLSYPLLNLVSISRCVDACWRVCIVSVPADDDRWGQHNTKMCSGRPGTDAEPTVQRQLSSAWLLAHLSRPTAEQHTPPFHRLLNGAS
jgi:hypothetical protein